MVRMRGVTTMGTDWTSGEASDLVEPPLNLVLYMHLRIIAYTSNTLITSFDSESGTSFGTEWESF